MSRKRTNFVKNRKHYTYLFIQIDSAIDMFDEGNNQNTYEQESGGFGGSGSAFYDPNAYTKSQTPSSWDQPQTNDQAYQRG